MFKLSLLKKFFEDFIKVETREADNGVSTTKVTYYDKVFGEVRYKTPNSDVKKIDVRLLRDNKNTLNYTSVIKTTNDYIFIGVSETDFDLFNTDDGWNIFIGIISHEVGHILAGHFDITNVTNGPGRIDVNKPAQIFLFSRYLEDSTESNLYAYLKTLFFGLLKGGCFEKELEADMNALKFVEVSTLVSVHGLDLDSKHNVYTALEKKNRISRLLNYAKHNQIDRKGYELSLTMHPQDDGSSK